MLNNAEPLAVAASENAPKESRGVVNSGLNWGDITDDLDVEAKASDDAGLLPPAEVIVNSDGSKTTTTYSKEGGDLFKRIQTSTKVTARHKVHAKRSGWKKFGECKGVPPGTLERGITMPHPGHLQPIHLDFTGPWLAMTTSMADKENEADGTLVMTKTQILNKLGASCWKGTGTTGSSSKDKLRAWNKKNRENLTGDATGDSSEVSRPWMKTAGSSSSGRYKPPGSRSGGRDSEEDEAVLLLGNIMAGTFQHDIEELVDAVLDSGRGGGRMQRPGARKYRSYRARGFDRETNQVKVGFYGDTRPCFLIFNSRRNAEHVLKTLDGHLYGMCKLTCEFKKIDPDRESSSRRR